MTFAEEYLSHLREKMKLLEDVIFNGVDQPEYLISCGNRQGILYAIEFYEDLLKGRKENDAAT